jgi:hypothetical protein
MPWDHRGDDGEVAAIGVGKIVTKIDNTGRNQAASKAQFSPKLNDAERRCYDHVQTEG